MKVLFFIISCSIFLLSNVKFTETKYLSALDMEIVKHGIMNLEKDILSLKYSNPKQETIIYHENKLTLQNENNELKEYLYEEYPKIEYFGLLLKSIINNQYENLDNMFIVKQESNKKVLTSKANVSGSIDYLEVIHKNKELSTIIFYMTNKDKITIETSN